MTNGTPAPVVVHAPSLLGTIAEVARAVVIMPPAFLMLCLINVAFLWLALNFVEHQFDQRIAVMNRVLDQCFVSDMKKDNR